MLGLWGPFVSVVQATFSEALKQGSMKLKEKGVNGNLKIMLVDGILDGSTLQRVSEKIQSAVSTPTKKSTDNLRDSNPFLNSPLKSSIKNPDFKQE